MIAKMGNPRPADITMSAMELSAQRVIVAMSGGVDSSVAAALLVRQGYDVTGVFMCLGTAGNREADSRGCCSPQDAADARRVADRLGIPLYVVNLGDEFAPIIDYFVAEYAVGRTPNPCVLCNSRIKFGRLLHQADQLGARYVATGHYAQMVDAGGSPAIARACNVAKDQSYALFAIARAGLGRMMLPIGEIADKQTVRDIARELGLNVHDKPDSQEICFVADDDYAGFVRGRAPESVKAGSIVDSSGKVMGRHDGFTNFTIGQRHGLKVGGLREPHYVTRIDAASGDVTIGPRAETMSSYLRAADATWHAETAGEFEAIVQIRYNHRGAPARVRRCGDDAFEVDFHEPVSSITPGQAAVVYDGQRLVGGGWIC